MNCVHLKINFCNQLHYSIPHQENGQRVYRVSQIR